MTHTTSRGSSGSSDKTNNRLVRITVLLQPFGSFFLGTATNFTNHDNSLCLRIISKSLQAINKIGTIERISTNSYARGLSEASHGCLVNSLVRQGSTSRYHTNLSGLVNVSGHDSNLAFTRLDDSGAVWTDQSGRRLLSKGVFDSSHILLRNTFSDCNHQWDLGFDRIHDCLSAKRGGDVNDRRIWFDGLFCFHDRIKDGEAEVFLPALFGGYSTHHIRSIFYCLGGVKRSLLSGKALTNNFCVLIDPHICSRRHGSHTGAGDRRRYLRYQFT
mmetsp:Transcript_641/g.1521  ORF Transcript_641/g.1521 Transcript_641/m.1521 type:complete len:273 (-) Transcript_641:133-951(-)